MKDDFISTVSHELRTPLTSIRALSEILHDNPELDREQRVRFLGIVIKESERLTRLINQVLDLARLEAGKGEWHPVAIDVVQVVDEAVAATSRLFAEKRIAVEIDVEPELPRVNGDRDRLIQVMLNLLSNAVKFSPEATGRVHLALYREGDEVRIDVADNGIGIAPVHHESVFEKFQQVGDTMTEKPAGSGLGLAICRQIVGHFGGRLWVASQPGAGAIFSFTLPLRPPTGLPADGLVRSGP
jgi:hypothetical protein